MWVIWNFQVRKLLWSSLTVTYVEMFERRKIGVEGLVFAGRVIEEDIFTGKDVIALIP